MNSFSNIRALIIDMDGVLWHGNQPIDGLIDFFQLLRDQQLPFILATNNARLTQDEYVLKLANMGVVVSKQEILTSSMATALYLTKRYPPEMTRVFVIGEQGLTEPLVNQGFTLTDLYQVNSLETPNVGADIVVCGIDTQLSWDKLATATLNIRAGAQFIATNGDTTLPTERGVTQGNGAILTALEAATGVKPICVGKPEPIMYQQAMNLLGSSPEETMAIGDRLDTDILGAINTDIRSLMVLTGISSQADLEAVDYAPTWVMDDIRSITHALQHLIK